ncbi:MAG TPA: flagellar biosynthesis regulator FlaF [Opitutaceae bacterium]|nr:flagellar biosynthesis regulator FlaF [Opitutaceae bacterium]
MNAHTTYKKIQKETLSGRDVEVQVLRKAATQYRQALSAGDEATRNRLLDAAVRYNLRVWDVFQADWERPDCPLTPSLRSDLLRLSLYVHRNSMDVLAYGNPEKINTLININECLAEGLVSGSRAPLPSLAPA